MPTVAAQKHDLSLRGVWIAYVLHMLIVTAPIAALINALCIREYKRHWCEPEVQAKPLLLYLTSHHQWLLTTFFVTVLLAMVTVGTIGSGFGVLVAIAAVIWWIYRMIKGVAELVKHHAVPLAVEWSCDTQKMTS